MRRALLLNIKYTEFSFKHRIISYKASLTVNEHTDKLIETQYV